MRLHRNHIARKNRAKVQVKLFKNSHDSSETTISNVSTTREYPKGINYNLNLQFTRFAFILGKLLYDFRTRPYRDRHHDRPLKRLIKSGEESRNERVITERGYRGIN